MTVPGATPASGGGATAPILLALQYQQMQSQRQIAKMQADLQKATQQIAKLQAKAISQASKQSAAQFAVDVENYRKQIQAALEKAGRAPREQGDVLKAAGMSADRIKAAQVELNRAGSSVAAMERAMRRLNVPALQARAMALAMKEAANEAASMQRDLNESFFRWRRISEQGVRLSEVGFILGAGGAAILAPLTLAATQYVERFRSLEDEAAAFTAIQNEQKEAMSDLGREASVALMPVMELLLDVLKKIVQVVKDNPDLLVNIVKGGAGLAALGTAMVLFGRVESVIGRMGAMFLSQMPGSIYVPGMLGFGKDRTTGFAGGWGQGVPGIGLKAGLSIGIVAGLDAAILKVIDSLAETTPAFAELKSRMDITGDGVLDLNDVLAALRVGLYAAITTLVDGFFRVATAVANFISIIGELPERIKNWVQGNGFVTDAGMARRDELEGRRQTLIDEIGVQQSRALASQKTDQELRDERFSLQQDIADKEAVIASNERLMEGAGVELRDSLGAMNDTLREEIRQLGNSLKGTEDELFRRQRIIGSLFGGEDAENPATRLQELMDDLKALDEAIVGETLGGMSPQGQAMEEERVRVLEELSRSMAEFVRSGTIGAGGDGSDTSPGGGPTDEPTKPIGPTPEELALFGAFRQAEMQAERQFNQQLADMARQRRLQELQAEREYLRNREQMLREQARQERDMLEDHALDVQQAQIEFARKEADIERKRQFDRLQKLREHELKLTELAAARDVAGFVEAQKRFALEQKQEEKQADFDKKQRQREFDIERADKEREFQHQLAQQRRANQEQLDDAKRAYDVQKDERLRQYNEQLQQMRTEQDRQRQERLRDFAQQLDDLRVSQGTLTEERRAYNEEIRKGYSELLAAHGEELKRALQQAYGLSASRTSTPNYLPPMPQNNRSVTIPSSTLRLTRFKVGSRNVPRDMIAHLDAGERVLTAQQNRQYGPLLDQMERGTWPTSNRTTIINITGNAFGRVASMEDVNELGMAIVQGMEDSGVML